MGMAKSLIDRSITFLFDAFSPVELQLRTSLMSYGFIGRVISRPDVWVQRMPRTGPMAEPGVL